MISTREALDALKAAELVNSWRWINEGEGEFKETLPDVKSTQLSVSDETYSDESYLYFRCKNQQVADKAAAALQHAGGTPDFTWCPDSPAYFSLKVNYFKGSRHWE